MKMTLIIKSLPEEAPKPRRRRRQAEQKRAEEPARARWRKQAEARRAEAKAVFGRGTGRKSLGMKDYREPIRRCEGCGGLYWPDELAPGGKHERECKGDLYQPSGPAGWAGDGWGVF